MLLLSGPRLGKSQLQQYPPGGAKVQTFHYPSGGSSLLSHPWETETSRRVVNVSDIITKQSVPYYEYIGRLSLPIRSQHRKNGRPYIIWLSLWLSGKYIQMCY